MEKSNSDEELKHSAHDLLTRIKQLGASQEWKPNGDKPCLMYKMEIGERMASKGVTKVNFPFQKVIQFLEKEDSLKKVSPMLNTFKFVYIIEGQFKVIYMEYDGIWPVAKRDFVALSIIKRQGDNLCFIASKSCNYPIPEVKDVVRGELYMGGYIIQKLDETNTLITYISDVDLKGSIPGMIKKVLTGKEGEIAAKVGPIMKQEGY